MVGLTDRQRVERAFPAYLLLGVLLQGADDPSHPDAIETREMLLKAASEPLLDLPKEARDKLSRRLSRLHDVVTKPYRQNGVRVDKLGLVIFYAIQALVEQSQLNLSEGGAMQKALALMAGALQRAAADAQLGAQARGEVSGFLMQLQRLGYYGGIKINDCPVELETAHSAQPQGAG